MKRILILGAAKNQMCLIRKAKELGYYVIVIDWTNDNPGIELADKHYKGSICDEDFCLQVAIKENIDGVISNYEPAMPVCAYISTRLGLPGNDITGVKNLMNKSKCRIIQKHSGVYTPEFIICDDLSSVITKSKNLRYPIVIKPCEYSGSKGTSKIDHYDEQLIIKAYEDCLRISRDKAVAVEEFIEMPMLTTVEGEIFICNGEFLWNGLMFTTRNSFAPLIPATYSMPIILSKNQRLKVKSSLEKLFNNAGIKNGEYNIEGFFTNENDFFIIEINVRHGGNGLPNFVSIGTGLDYLKLLLTTSVSDYSYWDTIKSIRHYPQRYIANHVVYSNRNGILKKINISDEISGFLVGIEYLVSEGKPVFQCKNALDMIGMVHLEFPSLITYQKYYNKLETLITAVVE